MTRHVHHTRDSTLHAKINEADLICPLTGNRDIEVLEEFPSSLLIACYQRDLGINVASAFKGVEKLQLCRCASSDLLFFFSIHNRIP